MTAQLQYGIEGERPYSLYYAHSGKTPLSRFIASINQNGAWFFSKGDKEPVKGIVLSLFWIAEALCIFGGSLGVAYGLLREEMFCEPCNRWCGKGATIRRTAPGDAIRLK